MSLRDRSKCPTSSRMRNTCRCVPLAKQLRKRRGTSGITRAAHDRVVPGRPKRNLEAIVCAMANPNWLAHHAGSWDGDSRRSASHADDASVPSREKSRQSRHTAHRARTRQSVNIGLECDQWSRECHTGRPSPLFRRRGHRTTLRQSGHDCAVSRPPPSTASRRAKGTAITADEEDRRWAAGPPAAARFTAGRANRTLVAARARRIKPSWLRAYRRRQLSGCAVDGQVNRTLVLARAPPSRAQWLCGRRPGEQNPRGCEGLANKSVMAAGGRPSTAQRLRGRRVLARAPPSRAQWLCGRRPGEQTLVLARAPPSTAQWLCGRRPGEQNPRGCEGRANRMVVAAGPPPSTAQRLRGRRPGANGTVMAARAPPSTAQWLCGRRPGEQDRGSGRDSDSPVPGCRSEGTRDSVRSRSGPEGSVGDEVVDSRMG